MPEHRIHSQQLLDALQEIKPIFYKGAVWRTVISHRNPLVGSQKPGRWNDETFEVLYTSLEPDTSLAEIRYYLFELNPVPPSKLSFILAKLSIRVERKLRLLDFSKLEKMGVIEKEFYAHNYKRVKEKIYPHTQAIGAAAKFLEFDGLHIPSARRKDGSNLVLFLDNCTAKESFTVEERKEVDWQSWAE